MALPISIPNTFATETNNIPLSDLDQNFTTVVNAINGIGSGLEPLANVVINGGTIANVTATNVTANVVSISNVTITGGSIANVSPIAVVSGGTGANTAAVARTNLSAAQLGANSDITSLSGLTTALSVPQGGTGLANVTANAVLIGGGVNAISTVAPGASGNLLTSTGTVWQSSAPPPAIGVGQTWQDMTSSRTAGTTYTNSTGKPIQVIASFQSSNQTNFTTGTINGLTVYGSVTTSSGHWGTISYIVPNGNTYSANMNGGSVTATNWLELR
jgi:hypothetical protein